MFICLMKVEQILSLIHIYLKSSIEEKLESIRTSSQKSPSQYLDSVKNEVLELKQKYKRGFLSFSCLNINLCKIVELCNTRYLYNTYICAKQSIIDYECRPVSYTHLRTGVRPFGRGGAARLLVGQVQRHATYPIVPQ